ncbi:hypothetical protein Bbelb_333960 [Branchiostoma belcheri]|nr:hypothetical protein Bbelb_333960 [Branchiostoma belcheri]
MERNINTYVKKWLGVPNSLTNIAIHSRKAKLNIPVRSLVEEFKVAKVRTSMTLSNSKDPVIRNFQPDLRSGRKWRVSAAVEEAEARLRHKEVVGATQTGRQGLGLIRHKWWSSATEKERREMVVQEVREQEEEKRVAVAAGQAKQGMWTTWESVEQRNISFNVLWQMEPLRISFLWRSTYDLLPTPANLSKWYEERSDCCAACGQKGTLQHILSACPSALSSGKYTWRHNNVLRVIVDAIKGRVECVNAEEVPAGNQYFTPFLKEGSQPRKDTSSKRKPSILSAANDWKVKADLDGEGGFPQEIALTLLRPDIVIWSESSREVVFGELSVPWEGNIEEAYERKLTRYAELEAVCRDKGWRVPTIRVSRVRTIRVSRSVSGGILQEIRQTNMVAALVVVFVLCWVPLFVLPVMQAWTEDSASSDSFILQLHMVLVTARTILDPAIYTCSSRAMLCCRKRGRVGEAPEDIHLGARDTVSDC